MAEMGKVYTDIGKSKRTGDYYNELVLAYFLTRAGVKSILIDFSLTGKAATLIFISWRGSAISSAKEGKSGFIYNLGKS